MCSLIKNKSLDSGPIFKILFSNRILILEFFKKISITKNICIFGFYALKCFFFNSLVSFWRILQSSSNDNLYLFLKKT